MKRIVVLFSLFFLISCTFKSSNLRNISSQENEKLCISYSKNYKNKSEIENEINKRNLIQNEYWDEIDQNMIADGMNHCAVLTAWGKPNSRNSFSAPDSAPNPDYTRSSFEYDNHTVYFGGGKVDDWSER